jgi:hypothetical protein
MARQMLHEVRQTDLCSANGKPSPRSFFACALEEMAIAEIKQTPNLKMKSLARLRWFIGLSKSGTGQVGLRPQGEPKPDAAILQQDDLNQSR